MCGCVMHRLTLTQPTIRWVEAHGTQCPCAFCCDPCARYGLLRELLALEVSTGRFAEAAELCEQLGDQQSAVEYHSAAGNHQRALVMLVSMLRRPVLWGKAGTGEAVGAWPPKPSPQTAQLMEHAKSQQAHVEASTPSAATPASTTAALNELHALELCAQLGSGDLDASAAAAPAFARLQRAGQLTTALTLPSLILARVIWEHAVRTAAAAAAPSSSPLDSPEVATQTLEAAKALMAAWEACTPVFAEALRVSRTMQNSTMGLTDARDRASAAACLAFMAAARNSEALGQVVVHAPYPSWVPPHMQTAPKPARGMAGRPAHDKKKVEMSLQDFGHFSVQLWDGYLAKLHEGMVKHGQALSNTLAAVAASSDPASSSTGNLQAQAGDATTSTAAANASPALLLARVQLLARMHSACNTQIAQINNKMATKEGSQSKVPSKLYEALYEVEGNMQQYARQLSSLLLTQSERSDMDSSKALIQSIASACADRTAAAVVVWHADTLATARSNKCLPAPLEKLMRSHHGVQPLLPPYISYDHLAQLQLLQPMLPADWLFVLRRGAGGAGKGGVPHWLSKALPADVPASFLAPWQMMVRCMVMQGNVQMVARSVPPHVAMAWVVEFVKDGIRWVARDQTAGQTLHP